MLLGAGSEPRSGLFKGKIECFVRGGGTFGLLFCVRGMWGGESVSKGTDETHFVREPVVDLLFLAVRLVLKKGV